MSRLLRSITPESLDRLADEMTSRCTNSGQSAAIDDLRRLAAQLRAMRVAQ